jgi:hypothetical protein
MLIASIRFGMRLLVNTVLLLCFFHVHAAEPKAETVWLRIPFFAETNYITTAAGLRVREYVYPDEAWWESSGDKAPADRKVLSAVIHAIATKDRDALFRLSDPDRGQDSTRFAEQSAALFQQFELLRITGITRAYGVDGVLIFALEIKAPSKTLLVPFVFVCRAEDDYRFLPYKTDTLGYYIVRHWLECSPGRNLSDSSMRIPNADISRLTYEVPLPQGTNAPTVSCPKGIVRFTGGRLTEDSKIKGIMARAQETIDSIKKELQAGEYDAFGSRIHPAARGKVLSWLSSSNSEDRGSYVKALIDLEPVFILDASPLIVVYGRTPMRRTEVLYFIVAKDGSLLWTNSSRITVEDRLFKGELLSAEALRDKPLERLEIR